MGVPVLIYGLEIWALTRRKTKIMGATEVKMPRLLRLLVCALLHHEGNDNFVESLKLQIDGTTTF
jgi:hypothetical protein